MSNKTRFLEKGVRTPIPSKHLHVSGVWERFFNPFPPSKDTFYHPDSISCDKPRENKVKVFLSKYDKAENSVKLYLSFIISHVRIIKDLKYSPKFANRGGMSEIYI